MSNAKLDKLFAIALSPHSMSMTHNQKHINFMMLYMKKYMLVRMSNLMNTSLS